MERKSLGVADKEGSDGVTMDIVFFPALDSVCFLYTKTTSVSSDMRFEIHRIIFDHRIRKTHARERQN